MTRTKKNSSERSVVMLNIEVQVLTGRAIAKVQSEGPGVKLRERGRHQRSFRRMLIM